MFPFTEFTISIFCLSIAYYIYQQSRLQARANRIIDNVTSMGKWSVVGLAVASAGIQARNHILAQQVEIEKLKNQRN